MAVREVNFDKDEPLASVGKEPEKASKALHDYAMLGVSRSFVKLIRRYQSDAKEVAIYKANPSAWPVGKAIPVAPPTLRETTISDWSRAWAWQARTARWDEIERERERLEYQQASSAMRKQRIKLYKDFFDKITSAVTTLDPQKASWNDVTQAVRTVGGEMRVDLGGDSEGASQGGRRIATVVIELPADK